MLAFTVILQVLLTLSLAFALQNPVSKIEKVCKVKALGDGRDDGPKISDTFKECNKNARIELDGNYTIGTVLNTTNLHNVEINLTGNITYTPNITYWSPASIFLTYQNATTYWLLGGENIYLHGGGTLDANGAVWWEYFAENPDQGVAGGSSTTFARPIPLTIYNSKHALIHDIRIINSPFWHNFVYQSENIVYDSITLTSVSSNASAPALNSDGWDTYRSSYVTIQNSVIDNDDDCVSFKPNSTYITVTNLYCNGGDGISVGSLGQYAGEMDTVANVCVSHIQMLNSQNGARIKVFGGSNDSTSVSGGGTGTVQNVTFKDFHVKDVDTPIIIDQCFSTPEDQCQAYPSRVNISDIHFINVKGTSSGKENGTVVSLDCSSECCGITASGTNLSAPGFDPVYLCSGDVASESLLDFNCTDSGV